MTGKARWCLYRPVCLPGSSPSGRPPGVKVNAECAALPPLGSVLQLRGPATGDEDWREMLVLWFGTEYGIPQAVLDHVLQLDWQQYSWACRY